MEKYINMIVDELGQHSGEIIPNSEAKDWGYEPKNTDSTIYMLTAYKGSNLSKDIRTVLFLEPIKIIKIEKQLSDDYHFYFIELIKADVLSKEQVKLLSEISHSGSVLRIFLSKEEIKDVNILVKQEYLEKGTNDMKNGTCIFFATRKGEDYLLYKVQ